MPRNAETLSIEAALAAYLRQIEADGRSHHTIAQARRHICLLAAWLRQEGHCGHVEDVCHEDLAEFLASPEARTRADGGPKKATSMNALRSTLRTFFTFTSDAGYAEQNAARLVRRARCGSPRPRGLSADEQRWLLETLARAEGETARRDHALFHTMLATGIRVGSAVQLDIEDVDLNGGVLHLRRAKGDRSEVGYLGRDVGEHLRAFLGDRTAGPAFPGRDGHRLTTRHVHRRLAHWLREAGIARRISPHSLRHAFALNLYQRTGDVLLVKQALGHRSIASTLVYARCDEARLRAAVGA